MAVDTARIAKNTLFLYFRMFLAMGVSLVAVSATLYALCQEVFNGSFVVFVDG